MGRSAGVWPAWASLTDYQEHWPAWHTLAIVAAENDLARTIATRDRVVFLGDSLTAYGCSKKDGWVRQVVARLAAQGVQLRPVCAGGPGNRSIDLLARFDRDVVARRPDWVVVNCGVNDVWHGEQGCTLDEFRDSLAAMLDRARDAGITALCSTATPIGEDLANAANLTLAAYNDAVLELATARRLRLAGCNRAFADALRAPGAVPGGWLTEDGVHFNARGETTMARAVLAAWNVAMSS